MKHLNKLICVVLVCSSILLFSCEKIEDYERPLYQAGFDKGYGLGYDDGRFDGEQSGYDEGYNDGFRDGQDESMSRFEDYILSEAAGYAIREGGWHPEEAMCIIEAYEAGESYGDTVVTQNEYEEAVASLMAFYEYFYNKMYMADLD